jgi:hypothetical protein
VEGLVIGDEVNLRAGPSRLFPVLQTFPYHAAVSVLNAAPGREWLQVRSADGVTGWMKAQYVQVDLAIEAISLAPVSQDWIRLKGSVKDSNGRPVVGAYVQLYDSQGHSAETRSWEDSYFYLLLPVTSQGRWTLVVLRPACRLSASISYCPGPGNFMDNPRTLELTGDQAVEVVYQLDGL